MSLQFVPACQSRSQSRVPFGQRHESRPLTETDLGCAQKHVFDYVVHICFFYQPIRCQEKSFFFFPEPVRSVALAKGIAVQGDNICVLVSVCQFHIKAMEVMIVKFENDF